MSEAFMLGLIFGVVLWNTLLLTYITFRLKNKV